MSYLLEPLLSLMQSHTIDNILKREYKKEKKENIFQVSRFPISAPLSSYSPRLVLSQSPGFVFHFYLSRGNIAKEGNKRSAPYLQSNLKVRASNLYISCCGISFAGPNISLALRFTWESQIFDANFMSN